MQYNFGVGLVTATPSGANPTPIPFGVIQDCQIDIDWTEKDLRGEMQAPVATARAALKIVGSAKWGRINALAFGQILTGSTTTTGEVRGIGNEPGTVPTTPFQVTTVNGANGVADLGVFDVTAGIILTRVASSPTTGQYSVVPTTGVYTFAAADTGHTVWISYSYSSSSTGKTVSYTNQIMGSQSTYVLTLFNQFGGNYLGAKLWAVTLSKLSLPLKSEDFTIQDTTITGYADSSGRIIDLYTAG